MAKNQNKALPRDVIKSDRESVLALKNVRDYAPSNPELQVEAVSALEVQLRQAEEAEIMAQKALKSARGARIAAGWKLHNAILGVKASVIGQFGASSEQVEAIGLKKKSDYDRPARRNGTPT